MNEMMEPYQLDRERYIWGHKVILPEPPPKEDIINHDLPPEEQFIKPMDFPDVDEMDVDEKKDLMTREMKRRKEGLWYYNNGNIEYITGTHYFYINYWTLDDGKRPSFIDSDRDLFQLWDLRVVPDDNLYGLYTWTRRRAGKSNRGNCILYEPTSRQFDKVTGIQSKNDKDASRLFSWIVKAWKKMPEWSKPVDAGMSNPQSELRFENPATRKTKTKAREEMKALDSYISYASSNTDSYDGWKLFRLCHDEVGKKMKYDPEERWNVCKMSLDDDGVPFGKCYMSTTVEEVTTNKAKSMWDDSELNEEGKSKTGLLRYFEPADKGYRACVDEHGYTDREKAKELIKKEREGLKGEELYTIMRKKPLTVQEAVRSAALSSPFPTYKVMEQKEHNESTGVQNELRVGNFVWEDGVYDSRVVFEDDPDGLWQVVWFPPKELRNHVRNRMGVWVPGNTHLSVSGVDPVDHSRTNFGGSKCASHVLRKLDLNDIERSNTVICQYYGRRDRASEFFEDMIKQAVFYGHQILPETNKIGLVEHFMERGYINFLMDRPYSLRTSKNKKGKGLPTNAEWVREYMLESTEMFCYDRIGWVDKDKLGLEEDMTGFFPFDETLEDMLHFDPNSWTEYDLTVSLMLTVVANRTKKVNEDQGEEKRDRPKKPFPKFKAKGSKMVKKQ